MAVKRADHQLGTRTKEFIKAHTGAVEPRFVLLCWEADDDPAAPATDLYIISNADDADIAAALDVAQAEIDDPSP